MSNGGGEVALHYAPLATAQLCQTLFPYTAQLYFDLEAVHQILAIWRLQFRKVSRKKLCKDAAKVPEPNPRSIRCSSVKKKKKGGTSPVDFLPRLFQRVALVPVKFLDRLFDLLLVFQHSAEHLLKARLALLDAGKKEKGTRI
jgi:hypothetical protein